MIKRLLSTLLLFVNCAQAGLPPTSSKISGDSSNVTTFNYQFPNLTGSHSGTTVSITTYPVPAFGTNGNVLTDNGSAWVSSAPGAASSFSESALGLGLATSVSSNALTIALKQPDGSTDPTAGNPVYVPFRSSTVTSGAYNRRTVTAALSVTVPSGTTIGTTSGNVAFINIYALDNAGTVELAVSLDIFDEGSVQTTTAISGGSSAFTLYSTTARSNVPVHRLGRIKITESTAGTWASNSTEVAVIPAQIFNVSSNATGQQRSEWAIVVNTNGSQSITSQSGSWLSASSCSATGICTFTMAGFSNTPACSCSVDTNGISCSAWASSQTSVTLRTRNGAGDVNASAGLICMGPR